MPSHKIHIKVAEEVNKTLNLDENKILIGSILPDLSKQKHYIAHFKTKKNNHLFYNTELFLSKYDINNDVIVGYLIHLLTDKYYNKYLKENYYIFKDNDLCGIKTNDGDLYCSKADIENIKHDDFHNYDFYLLQNNKFKKLKYIDDLPLIDECDYSKDYLKEYIKSYNKEISSVHNEKIKFKYLNLKDGKEIYDGCINYILDYLSICLKK